MKRRSHLLNFVENKFTKGCEKYEQEKTKNKKCSFRSIVSFVIQLGFEPKLNTAYFQYLIFSTIQKVTE